MGTRRNAVHSNGSRLRFGGILWPLMLLLLASCNPATTDSREPTGGITSDSEIQQPPENNAPPVPVSNWPLFRGNAAADGVTSVPLPADLKLLWQFELENAAFQGTAAIVDGVVYIGDLDGLLLAIDLE